MYKVAVQCDSAMTVHVIVLKGSALTVFGLCIRLLQLTPCYREVSEDIWIAANRHDDTNTRKVMSGLVIIIP